MISALETAGFALVALSKLISVALGIFTTAIRQAGAKRHNLFAPP